MRTWQCLKTHATGFGERLGEIARASRATSPCLDAETLAAWADGGLTTVAALGVETHLASCPECRAIAVLLGTTDAGETAPAAPTGAIVDIASARPAAAATAAPRRRWVLPAGIGAAAAVALWFATAGRNPATPSPTYTQPMSETAPRSAPSDARAGGAETFGRQGQASPLAPPAATDSANQLSQESRARTAPPSPEGSLESSLAKSRADSASPARQGETEIGGRSAGAREMVAEAPVAVAALPAAPPPAQPSPPPPAAAPVAGPIPAPAEAFARAAEAPLMRSVGGIVSDPRFVCRPPMERRSGASGPTIAWSERSLLSTRSGRLATPQHRRLPLPVRVREPDAAAAAVQQHRHRHLRLHHRAGSRLLYRPASS